MADDCFNQLKSEIKLKEFHFRLFREYIEDYPEVVLRKLLINAIAHRDYSRQQIIEIRKYPTYIEFESPGHFRIHGAPKDLSMQSRLIYVQHPRLILVQSIYRSNNKRTGCSGRSAGDWFFERFFHWRVSCRRESVPQSRFGMMVEILVPLVIFTRQVLIIQYLGDKNLMRAVLFA